jgi:hypothetical protein
MDDLMGDLKVGMKVLIKQVSTRPLCFLEGYIGVVGCINPLHKDGDIYGVNFSESEYCVYFWRDELVPQDEKTEQKTVAMFRMVGNGDTERINVILEK